MKLPSRRGGRWPGRLLAAAIAFSIAPIGRAQPDDSGVTTMPIVEYVVELEARGFSIIYGSDLLPDSLDMQRPEVDRGLATLESALRPHGLTLRPGPRSTWLVVRAARADADAAAPPAAPRPVFGPPVLESIVVSASRYAYTRAAAPSTMELDHTQLMYAPTLGADALRAMHSLPGLTSSGLTARVNVRGGDTDEALLYVDGVRLYNPFHLKDFQGLFSSLSPQIVESMSVYTGAYPAEYGDRMSAVIDIETIEPQTERLLEIGVSTLTTSVLGAGQFDDGSGSWVGSLRRGNIDLLIDAADTNVGTPQYVDAFGKIRYEISEVTGVSAGLLVLNDKITLNDVGTATSRADYSDAYVWTSVDFTGERFAVEALISAADLTTHRRGSIDDPFGSLGTLDDVRDFTSIALRVDWSYAFGDAQGLRGGVELRDVDAEYAFASQRVERMPIVSALPGLPERISDAVSLAGRQQAWHLSYRARAGDRLTTEIGVRYDAQSQPDDSQVSPRFNVLYDIGDRISLRGSWGRYFQSQGLDELQIADGITRLYPAQESEHTVLGAEILAAADVSLRIEVYRKEFERLRPRFENLFGRVALLPEIETDRVMLAPARGEASGIEASIAGQSGEWRWWANAARALANDLIAGVNVDRSWEEPWSVKGGFLWQGPRWTVSLSTAWHTGWPITPVALVDGELVAGAFNSVRLEDFSSIDVRASRAVPLRRGEFEWFVELNNAFDSENPCCIDFDVEFDAGSMPSSLDVSTERWLPVIPSIGFVWRVGGST